MLLILKTSQEVVNSEISFYKGSLLKKDIPVIKHNNESQNQNEIEKRIAVLWTFCLLLK